MAFLYSDMVITYYSSLYFVLNEVSEWPKKILQNLYYAHNVLFILRSLKASFFNTLTNEHIYTLSCQPCQLVFNYCLHKNNCSQSSQPQHAPCPFILALPQLTPDHPAFNSYLFINSQVYSIYFANNFLISLSEDKHLELIRELQQHLSIDNWVYCIYAIYGQK